MRYTCEEQEIFHRGKIEVAKPKLSQAMTAVPESYDLTEVSNVVTVATELRTEHGRGHQSFIPVKTTFCVSERTDRPDRPEN